MQDTFSYSAVSFAVVVAYAFKKNKDSMNSCYDSQEFLSDFLF